MKAIIATGALALVLTGCQGFSAGKVLDKVNPVKSKKEPAAQVDKQVKTFVCDNDAEVQIRRINEDAIELSAPGGTPTVLTAVVSGSGEAYASKQGIYGQGGEWHQKANQAIFTYAGSIGSPAKCALKK